MQRLVILSGRSGAGKSSALNALEDFGFVCIDNLPLSVLPEVVNRLIREQDVQKLAVGIDIRTPAVDLAEYESVYRDISTIITPETIFLTAQEEKLIARFSATRRKHPLFHRYHILSEALKAEYEMLKPIAASAFITIDTTNLNIHELKQRLKLKLGENDQFVVLIQSFGFKHGVPLDADYVFDVRMLPNPHWQLSLRRQTGKDKEVIEYLEQDADVQKMVANLISFFEGWLGTIKSTNRHSISIAIGCTGGQHRSVFIVETLAKHFEQHWHVSAFHRETKHWPKPEEVNMLNHHMVTPHKHTQEENALTQSTSAEPKK